MSLCQDLLNGKYNLLLIFLIFILIFHCYYTRPEKMEGMADIPVTEEIKKAISDEIKNVYTADIESIRTLSAVAKTLQDGAYTTPGNLTIKQKTKTSDQVLKITDNNNWVSLNSSLGKGNYNPLVNDNDKGIIFTDGQLETGSLVIGPHSAESNGLKINNKGNIGVGKQPSDNKLDINGNVGIDGNLTFNNISTITSNGRMHLNPSEILYLLPKSGVIIGKEWGGTGNLSIQGNLQLNGQNGSSGQILTSLGDNPPMWREPYKLISISGGSNNNVTVRGGDLDVVSSNKIKVSVKSLLVPLAGWVYHSIGDGSGTDEGKLWMDVNTQKDGAGEINAYPGRNYYVSQIGRNGAARPTINEMIKHGTIVNANETVWFKIRYNRNSDDAFNLNWSDLYCLIIPIY